jgi:hypothetical protein
VKCQLAENDIQITVRRLRTVYYGPHNKDEAEYTVGITSLQGMSVKEVYEMADDIAAQVMNDKLPRPAIEQEPKEVLPDTSDDVYDRFSARPWKQSKKQPRLSTIRVGQYATSELEKELLDELRKNNNVIKVGDTTYKLSRTPDGTKFLQRWKQP